MENKNWQNGITRNPCWRECYLSVSNALGLRNTKNDKTHQYCDSLYHKEVSGKPDSTYVDHVCPPRKNSFSEELLLKWFDLFKMHDLLSDSDRNAKLNVAFRLTSVFTKWKSGTKNADREVIKNIGLSAQEQIPLEAFLTDQMQKFEIHRCKLEQLLTRTYANCRMWCVCSHRLRGALCSHF